MTKKLSGNGLFESSRMMLSEHREALNERQRVKGGGIRGCIDDQQLEELSGQLEEALASGFLVRINLIQEDEDQIVIGRITRHDALLQRIRIEHKWFNLSDIVSCDSESYKD